MNSALWIMGILGLGGLGTVLFLQIRSNKLGQKSEEYTRLQADYDRKIEEIGTLKAAINELNREKDKLSENGKVQYDNFKNQEKTLALLQRERDELGKRVQKFEAEEHAQQAEFKRELEQMQNAKIKFEQEQKRVIREDEEMQIKLEEERDRLWADHENSVISLLTDLCKQPSLSFSTFCNTQLPEGFDGSLKPDFMIEFLGQYIIFDAKVSKAKSLQTYINKQIEDTVAKVKADKRIYKWIFLVVPTQAISELKKHHYISGGYQVFVIAPESIPAILASLKHITLYEFAETLDPQERENIVQLVAELDFHINLRNATDIVLSKMGIDLLQKAQKSNPALAEEVAIKKQPMNAKASVAASDIKKIISELTAQNLEVQQLVSPKPDVSMTELEDAQKLLDETLQ